MLSTHSTGLGTVKGTKEEGVSSAVRTPQIQLGGWAKHTQIQKNGTMQHMA